MTQLVEGAAVWKSADIGRDTSWMITLTDEQRYEIVEATRVAVSRGAATALIARVDFPLPLLSHEVARWSEALATGRGFLLIRGFPIDLLDQNEVELAYAGLGAHLGKAVGQNSRGDLLTHIIDERLGADVGQVRLYRTNHRQDFHSDGADIIGLLCLHGSKSGGESKLVSSHTLYNELATHHPNLLEALKSPVAWDRQGDIPSGEQAWFELAPLNMVNGVPSLFYIGWYIRDAQRHADAPRLTSLQLEAMSKLEALANSPEFHIEMTFQPGDIQFINNGLVLHARESYEDFDELSRRRHLLRLWLASHQFVSVDAGLRTGIAAHRPEVLFVCVHNAGRSQMAAAFLAHHGGDRVVVRSAGTAPADSVNPGVVEAMAEVGIDLQELGAYPKRLDDAAVEASDVVITMGCGDSCPFFPGKRYLDWKLDDPAGQGVESIRLIRDEIESRVLELLKEIC